MKRATLLERIQSSVRESLRTQERFFSENLESLGRAFDEIVDVLRRGGKLMIIGNGGSAADAQHLAAEFVNRYQEDRPPLPAVALTTDTSALTAIGNDSRFRYVFSRQVEALGNREDLLIAITTSGNSENVLEGLQQAKTMGIRTLVLTGGDGGRALDLADAAIRVSVTDRTPRIQEALLLVEHLLCEWVEGTLFPPLNDSSPEAAGKDEP